MITPNLSLQEIHQKTGEFLQTLSPHTPTNLIELTLHTTAMHQLKATTEESGTHAATAAKVLDILKDVSRRLEALTQGDQASRVTDLEVNRLGLRVNDAISDLEDLLT
jgi:hypothetical protein